MTSRFIAEQHPTPPPPRAAALIYARTSARACANTPKLYPALYVQCERQAR